mgnify:CR=1 FL=1
MDFFTERTVKWQDSSVVLIDQRKLPVDFTYLRCTDYRQVVDAIRSLAVRGAPAIGVSAAMGVALHAVNSNASDHESLIDEMRVAAHDLANARPTAVNPSWAVERILKRILSADGVEEIKRIAVEEAVQLAEEDVTANKSIGRFGSSMIDDGDVVLTHCKWSNN